MIGNQSTGLRSWTAAAAALMTLCLGAAAAQAQTTAISKKQLVRELKRRSRASQPKRRWARQKRVGRLANPSYDALIEQQANCMQWRTRRLALRGSLQRLSAELAKPTTPPARATFLQGKIADNSAELAQLEQYLTTCPKMTAEAYIDWLVGAYGDNVLEWASPGAHSGDGVRLHQLVPPPGCGNPAYGNGTHWECRRGQWWSIGYDHSPDCDFVVEQSIQIVLDQNGDPISCEAWEGPVFYPSAQPISLQVDDTMACMLPLGPEAAASLQAVEGRTSVIEPFGSGDVLAMVPGAEVLTAEALLGDVVVLGGTIHYTAPSTFGGADEIAYTLTTETGEQIRGVIPVAVEPANVLGLIDLGGTSAVDTVGLGGTPGNKQTTNVLPINQ